MLNNLAALEAADRELLIDSIAMVTVLIAGADDEMDSKEIADSERITKVRSYAAEESLQDFYKEVGSNFSNAIRSLTASLPKRHAERAPILEQRLAGLNAVLAKLDGGLAYAIYKDLLSFASHVAKSSGGILGFLSTSYAERKLVDLPMIEPITAPE